YFSKKNVLAYLIDDRNRFIYISDSFLKLFGFDKSVNISYRYKNFVSIVLDGELPIKDFLSEERYKDVVYNILERFYIDISFMQDDESYKQGMNSILNHSIAKEIWNEILVNRPAPLRTLRHRTVYFKFHGFNIALSYSVQQLLNRRRFDIVEYVPNNLIIKLLSKL